MATSYASAQDPCADVINGTSGIEQYDELRTGLMETDKAGLERLLAFEESYLNKYGKCDTDAVKRKWIGNNQPGTDAYLRASRQFAGFSEIIRALPAQINGVQKALSNIRRLAMAAELDTAIKNNSWDLAMKAGKALFESDPTNVRVALVLASIGHDELSRQNPAYADLTVEYAKKAIELLNSDMPASRYFRLGILQFEYKDKADALAYMNYYIGNVLFAVKKDQEGALPYLAAALKTESRLKTVPHLYSCIGDYYQAKLNSLIGPIQNQVKELQNAKTDSAKNKIQAELDKKIGLLNGYAERAMDAYSRAYSVAGTQPEVKGYKQSLHDYIGSVYKVRYGTTEGLDKWIADAPTRQMPDPMAAVTAVIDTK